MSKLNGIKANVLVAGAPNTTAAAHYLNWHPNLHPVMKFKDAHIVMFTGGEDIHPAYYGDVFHDKTGAPNVKRDEEEKEIFSNAFYSSVPMIGICRGSQLGAVLSGAKLFQHVENHAKGAGHFITDKFGSTYLVNSTHHQMAKLDDLPNESYELIAWSYGVSPEYNTGFHKIIPQVTVREPEVVYYKHTRFLGIQSHPEFVTAPKPQVANMIKYVNTYILSQL